MIPILQFVGHYFISPFTAVPSGSPSGFGGPVRRTTVALTRTSTEQSAYLKKIEASRRAGLVARQIRLERSKPLPDKEIIAKLRRERGKLLHSMYRD